MSAAFDQAESPPAAAHEVRWRSWLVPQRPLVGLCIGASILALTALLGRATGSPVIAGFALLALSLAAWRAGLPIEFTVDDGGVKQRWLQRRRYDDWTAFRTFSTLPRGFMLWRAGNPCPLDAMEGLFLPNPPQSAELHAILERHLTEIA